MVFFCNLPDGGVSLKGASENAGLRTDRQGPDDLLNTGRSFDPKVAGPVDIPQTRYFPYRKSGRFIVLACTTSSAAST